jgi:hypothetical protein
MSVVGEIKEAVGVQWELRGAVARRDQGNHFDIVLFPGVRLAGVQPGAPCGRAS